MPGVVPPPQYTPQGSTPYGPDTRTQAIPGPSGWTPPKPGGSPGVPPTAYPTNPWDLAPRTTPTSYVPPTASPSPSPGGPPQTSYNLPSFQSFLQMQLAAGIDPATAVQQANAKFGAQSGEGAQFYAAGQHGATDLGTIGIPGGYFAKNADGSWGFVPRNEGGKAGPTTNNTPGATLTYDQALSQANALATQVQGHPLTDQQTQLLLGEHGGGPGIPVNPTEFQKVLTEIRSWGGGQAPPGTPPSTNPPPAYPTQPTIPPGPFSPPGNTGQDPLSRSANGALGFFNTGGTLGGDVRTLLGNIIGSGGFTPGAQRRLNDARDAEAMGFSGMLSDARGALADRGLLSEPGVPQGAETTAVRRIGESLAPTFAGALSGVETHMLDTANSNVQSALSLATGLSQSDAQNMLTSVSLSTNRQQTLSDIALKSLDQNMQWQEFLANYGLQRDQVTQAIQTGNYAAIAALIQQFLGSVNTSTGGFI